ncbi:hypothetical protein FHO94_25000 [Escherichia coli]|nr:hypothetical protein [Escherichia coli]
MKSLKFILPLFFFIVFSMVSIFLTGAVLYVCGEFFFFFYKGIPVSFSSNIILFLGKIGIYIGSFTGLMLWIANLLKK